jgi:hypothetical protein
MAGLMRKLAAAVLLAAFLALAAAAAMRGRPGPWHAQCAEFWSQQQWAEIRSLAQNLALVGETDAEAAYFAALAAQQMKEPEATRHFVLQFAERRPLNVTWEARLAPLTQPQSLRERLAFARARAALGLLALVAILNSAAALRRGRMLGWSAALSALGIAVLLL